MLAFEAGVEIDEPALDVRVLARDYLGRPEQHRGFRSDRLGAQHLVRTGGDDLQAHRAAGRAAAHLANEVEHALEPGCEAGIQFVEGLGARAGLRAEQMHDDVWRFSGRAACARRRVEDTWRDRMRNADRVSAGLEQSSVQAMQRVAVRSDQQVRATCNDGGRSEPAP